MSTPENKSERTQDVYLLAIFVAGIVVTVCAMVLAIVIAGQRPMVFVVNTPQPAAMTSSSPAGAGAPAPTVEAAPAPTPTIAEAGPQIEVAQVAAVPELSDPHDPAWQQVSTTEIKLLPQAMARPFLANATISSARVQAMQDGKRIAWRVSWPAAEPASNVDADRFSDAVAIQFSLEPGTPFMMGGPGKPVRILHWKALWQKDADEGFQDVQHVHPNFWADFYWFAKGVMPFAATEAFADPAAKQFATALSAGNPMADQERRQPIEELTAEGFGTATHVSDSPSGARGTWKDGYWTVVLDRPLTTDDPLASAIRSGKSDAVSFAIWDGSAENVGGRKHYCTWVPVKVKP